MTPPQRGGSGRDGSSPFVAEVNSSLEPYLVEHLFEPMLRRLPRSLHPNTISLLGHAASWAALAMAWLSTRQEEPAARALLLVGTGVALFAGMSADCLDGMQARRTGTSSRLGEMMDHWLDSIHVPLVTAGLSLGLELPPWAVVAVHVTNTMIYNSQLVLYHRTGRFVHPGTSGTDGQFGTSLGYLAVALVFYLWGRHNRWVDLGITVASLVAVVVHLRLNAFFYVRLGREVVGHLPFVLLALWFGAIYLGGGMDRVEFVLAIVFLSFRITGAYVMHSILGTPFSGFDWGVVPFLLLMTADRLGVALPAPAGLRPSSVLLWSSIAYMAARSLAEFARHLPELRPGRAAGDEA